MLFMVQNISFCSVFLLVMNCSIEIRVLKVKISVMLNRMMLEVVIWVQWVMLFSSRVVSRVKIKVLVEINYWLGILGRLILSIIVSVVLNVVVEEMLRVNGLVSGLLRMVCILVLVSFSVRLMIIVIIVQGRWIFQMMVCVFGLVLVGLVNVCYRFCSGRLEGLSIKLSSSDVIINSVSRRISSRW